MPDSRQGSFASAPHEDTARIAGLFLLASAAATVATVITRVAADADQPTMAESLGAVADGRAMYAASAAARCISGVALIAAAWLLTRTWIIRKPPGHAFRTVPSRPLRRPDGSFWRCRGPDRHVRCSRGGDG